MPVIVKNYLNDHINHLDLNLSMVMSELAAHPREVVDLHRQLTARPAVNPEHGGRGEGEKARWLEERLAGYKAVRQEHYDFPDSRVAGEVRPNIVAWMHGEDASAGRLWLPCHLDVAAAGPESLWRSGPFVLRQQGDWLYGRGVEDNHQAIVSALMLFEAFERLGKKPPIGLGAIFVSGSLIDYDIGLEEILRQAPGLFSEHDLVVVPDYGTDDGATIEIAEKTCVWIKVEVYGLEGHAGYSPGVNAFKAGACLIAALDGFSLKFPMRDAMFAIPHSTIEPTMSENFSTGYNHLAPKFVFYMDLRLIPGHQYKSVEKYLRQTTRQIEQKEGVTIEMEAFNTTPYGPATSAEAPVVKRLSRAVEAVLGVKTRTSGISGITLASSVRAHGIDAAVWSIQSAGKNKFNERYSVRQQIEQTKVLAHMLFDRSPLKKGRPPVSLTNPRHLTGREMEVADLLGRGYTNEKIMDGLGITQNTLRTHLKSLYRKTGLHSRPELAKLFGADKQNKG